MRMFIRLLSSPLLVISWASWATLKLTLATVTTTATPTSTLAVTPPPSVEESFNQVVTSMSCTLLYSPLRIDMPRSEREDGDACLSPMPK